MTIAAQEDITRITWPGSTSRHGWKTYVRANNGKTNENKLSAWKHDATTNTTSL